MSTRLDEIVEEELARQEIAPKRCGKRIAERAFRHGVDQERLINGGWTFVSEDVQPAPAEEKWWEGRKGERRKGREICPHAPEYSGRCFVFIRPDGTVYHAGDSRHKDRRKP
jgi:L-ascorbate metabolism protein UlaG (beta-lactamase superfamily)